jgi:transposase
MWTSKNRIRYDRSKLRYPSDLTDAEWKLIEPLIPPGKPGGDKRTVIMREVVNGLIYVLSTGCQWRAIPRDLPPKSTVYDYFDLWTYDGTLDRIHHALYQQCREQEQREVSPTAAIIDSQSVKSAEKGGPASIRMATMRARRSDQGQEAAYSRRYIRSPAARGFGCRSVSRCRAVRQMRQEGGPDPKSLVLGAPRPTSPCSPSICWSSTARICDASANFTYQAGSWTKPRRVIAKVEWHPGELYPRVGFIVTNMSRPAERVVAFYNKRGTCEQWIKEGKGASGSSFMRSPTISAIFCARWRRPSRSRTGR